MVNLWIIIERRYVCAFINRLLRTTALLRHTYTIDTPLFHLDRCGLCNENRRSKRQHPSEVVSATHSIQASTYLFDRLQMWDVAGQEIYGTVTKVFVAIGVLVWCCLFVLVRAFQLYYRGASGALILCDVTRQQTIEAIEKWKEDLDTNVCIPHRQRTSFTHAHLAFVQMLDVACVYLQ